MKNALTEKAFELVKQSENELLEQKQKYNRLLEDFNFNLNLIKERDFELQAQDQKIQQLENLVSKSKDYDELKFQLINTQSQLVSISKNYEQLKQDYKVQIRKGSENSGLLEQLQLTNEKQIIQMENLEQQLNQYIKKYDESEQKLDNNNEQLNYNTKQAYQLKQQNETIQQKYSDLLNELDTFKLKYTGQLQTNQQQETQLKELIFDNQKLSDYIQQIKMEQNNISKQKQEIEEVLEKLLQKYKTIKADHKQLDRQLNQSLQQQHIQVEQLNQQVKEYQTKEQNYESNLQQLSNQLDSRLQEIERLKKQFLQSDKQYISQISQLQAQNNLQHNDINNHFQQLKTDNCDLMNRVKYQEEQLKQNFQLISDLKQQNMQLEKQGVKEQISTMRRELEVLQVQNSKISNLLKLKEEQNQQLIFQLDEAQQQNNNYKQQYGNGQQKNQINILNEQISKLQQQIRDKQSELNETKTKLILQTTINTNGHLSGTTQKFQMNNQQQELIEKLKVKLKEAADQLREVIKENDEKEQIIMQQNNQLQQLKQQNRKIQIQNDQFCDEQINYKQMPNDILIQDDQQQYYDISGTVQNIIKQKGSNINSNQNTVKSPDIFPQEFPSQLIDKSELRGEIERILSEAGVKK